MCSGWDIAEVLGLCHIVLAVCRDNPQILSFFASRDESLSFFDYAFQTSFVINKTRLVHQNIQTFY